MLPFALVTVTACITSIYAARVGSDERRTSRPHQVGFIALVGVLLAAVLNFGAHACDPGAWNGNHDDAILTGLVLVPVSASLIALFPRTAGPLTRQRIGRTGRTALAAREKQVVIAARCNNTEPQTTPEPVS